MCSRPQYIGLVYLGSPDPVDGFSLFSIPTGLWLIEAYLQNSSVRSDAIVISTDGRTDRQTDIA